VVSVAAIDSADPALDQVESFSSRGPARIDFPARVDRAKPDLAGFDGVSISNAGAFPACPPFCAFFGTSAASPHTAGVAALLLQKSIADAARDLPWQGAVDIGRWVSTMPPAPATRHDRLGLPARGDGAADCRPGRAAAIMVLARRPRSRAQRKCVRRALRLAVACARIEQVVAELWRDSSPPRLARGPRGRDRGGASPGAARGTVTHALSDTVPVL
jgi:hypothetical protein